MLLATEPLARLGHYLRKLNSTNTYYINVTEAKYVGTEHSYFKGKPANSNPSLQRLFKDIFQGEVAEKALVFRPDINAYELK